MNVLTLLTQLKTTKPKQKAEKKGEPLCWAALEVVGITERLRLQFFEWRII